MFCGKSKLQIASDTIFQLRPIERNQFALPVIKDCLTQTHRCEELELSEDEAVVYKCGHYGDDLGPLARRCGECHRGA